MNFPKAIKHLTAITIFSMCFSVQAEVLTVTIKNIEKITGQLVVEVMDESFFKDEEGNGSYIKKVAVSSSTQQTTFSSIQPGEYAILVYQDLNSNDELDFSIFSGPQEPIGASNNAKFSLGLPSWNKAKIVKGINDKEIEISLKN